MIKSPLLQKSKAAKDMPKSTPVKSRDTQVSDMVGMPGTAFRRKVEAEIKGKPVEAKKPASPLKMVTEKGSYEKGKVEKYASKSAMVKHEKKENKSFEKKEGIKPVKGKTPPTKMKKC